MKLHAYLSNSKYLNSFVIFQTLCLCAKYKEKNIKAVVLKNITKCFPIGDDEKEEGIQVRDGAFYALDGVSLSVEEDTCTLIAGANGSGKNLLMSIIAGLETPTGGEVKTYASIGLVFQEPDSQILGETPREDIAFGPGNLDLSREEIGKRVENALAETGLAQRADFPARSLSGGEKRRLAAAGVIAMDAKIIIFDEPYANMDYQGVIQVNRLVQKLRVQKKTIIILSHETEKCLAMADRFIALNKGKIVFDGGARQALEQDLEEWGIHHPLKNIAHNLEGLVWL